jgi:pimeloyl-ACP methyl ester carboxylesterase
MHYATTSDGVRIAYISLGDGPPLVWASNIFGDATAYRKGWPAAREGTDRLVGLGWRVVLYDVRGMGCPPVIPPKRPKTASGRSSRGENTTKRLPPSIGSCDRARRPELHRPPLTRGRRPRQSTGAVRFIDVTQVQERYLARAREALGEAAFRAAADEGRATPAARIMEMDPGAFASP